MIHLERFSFFKKKQKPTVEDNIQWYKENINKLSDCLIEIMDDYNIPESEIFIRENGGAFWMSRYSYITIVNLDNDTKISLLKRIESEKVNIERRINHTILISDNNFSITDNNTIDIYFADIKNPKKAKGHDYR